MKPKISIIISIYNVEAYLRQCLDSVIGQTYGNLEIILIDDGSPDNCGIICDEYAQCDSRITVVHKENGGLSAGWNDGIKKATGEWIAFVDPDDWIDLSFFSSLIRNSDLDRMQVITATGYIEERDKNSRSRVVFDEPFSFYEGQGKEQMLLKTIEAYNNRFAMAWNRLYRREFLISENIFFDSHIPAGLSNDAVFNFEVFLKADYVQAVICMGYHYRHQNEAATLRYRPGRAEQMAYTFSRLQELVNQYPTDRLVKMLDARIFEDISANLSRDYFHPDNKDSYQTVAGKIKEMKKKDLYRQVINKKNNEFLPWKAVVLKFALRLPWIWPVKLLYCAKEKLKGSH